MTLLKIYVNPYVHCSIVIHNKQRWKQPKCPSTDKWRQKMWYTQPLAISALHVESNKKADCKETE